MPNHPLLIQLKNLSSFLNPEEKRQAFLDTIDYYSNIYSATDALDSILKVIDRLYHLKSSGQVFSDQGYIELEINIAFLNVLKNIFYALEKGYKGLPDLPQLTEDTSENIKNLNEWSDVNLEKILEFVKNK
jgi:hypothetical protein